MKPSYFTPEALVLCCGSQFPPEKEMRRSTPLAPSWVGGWVGGRRKYVDGHFYLDAFFHFIVNIYLSAG